MPLTEETLAGLIATAVLDFSSAGPAFGQDLTITASVEL